MTSTPSKPDVFSGGMPDGQPLSAANCPIYRQSGGDPKAATRVLLLHAIGFDATSWDRITPWLSDRFHWVAADLPGHGRSGKPADADYGPLSMGRRILELLEELGWERAVLVGNSLGGGVSLAAALQAPVRVQGLALLNSVGFRWGLPAIGRLGFFPFVARIGGHAPTLAIRWGLESVRHRRGSVTLDRCRACETYMRSADGRHAFFRALRQLYGRDLELMGSRYGEIRRPALVVHGERDRLLSNRHAERLAEALPEGRLVRIPRCGHFPQEECPDAVSEPLLRFLGQFDGGATTASRPFSG